MYTGMQSGLHMAIYDEGDPQVVKAAEPFERMFHREFPRMVALAYGITGNRWAAEELAQEACLRAYRSWSTVAGYDKPGAWLRRVTINLCSSFLRRRVGELKALERYVVRGIQPIEPHPDDEQAFWDAVRDLPRRQREAIVLRYVDDLSTAEIGEVLDIAESSVRTHLQRGRETLARTLDFGEHR